MPAHTCKRRRNPPDDAPLDAIPPSEMAASHTSCRPNGGVEPTIPQTPDPTDASIPGTPARQLIEAQASQLDAMAWASAVYGSLSPLFGTGTDKYSYKLFLDSFLGEIGPLGPVEKMLASQLFLAHHALGHLHVRGMNSGNPDAARIYLSAAARLMTEFRLTAAALKGFRPPAATPAKADVNSPPERMGVKEPHKRSSSKRPVATEMAGGMPTTDWYSEVTSNRLKELFRDELVGETA